MSPHNSPDPLEGQFNSLRHDRLPASSAHQQQLETQLMNEYAKTNPGRRLRHPRMLIALAVLIIAGSAVATTAVIAKYRQYNIEIKQDGEVISAPRILVEEGQEAQIFIGNDEESIVVDVLPDGTVVTEVTGDAEVTEVTVDVEEFDDPPIDDNE